MKLDKYTLTEKKFYAARKQLDQLRDKMRKLPYRKLEEPYQDGWKFTLVLRSDIANSSKAPALQYILDKFSRATHTKNPKHVSTVRKDPTLDAFRKIIINRHVGGYPLYVKDITEKEYNELPEGYKKYFTIVSSFISKIKHGGKIMYELNVPTFYFNVKTHKRIITQVQDIDPILKKQEAEIEKILEPYWRTCPYDQGYYHYFENRKERRKSKVDVAKMDLE